MKKLLLIFVIFFTGVSFSNAQETKDNSTYYYNIFDNSSLGTLNSVNTPFNFSASAAGNLNVGTSRCLTSSGNSTAGNINGSYVTAGTSLGNDDWEWSFLYKNTGGSVTNDPSTIANNTNAWRYWLMADGVTSGTASGFYITQFNNNLVIRYKYSNDAANPNNYNQVISYALPANNVTYAVKVQRLAGGLFKLYVDQYSAAIPEAKTLRGSNSPGGTSTYKYSMLECSTTTVGRFQFDDLKLYTRQFQFVAYNAGLTASAVGPGQANTIVYSVTLKMRGNYEFQQLILNESPGVTTYLTAENLYKSANATFTPAVPAPDTLKQAGNGNGYFSNVNDVYQSSGNLADGSLQTVGYYYIAGTTKNPLSGGTLTISGISSITTKDFNGAPAYTGYNSGGAATTPITFASTTISYTTPQTYTVGTAIAALNPTSTGSPTSFSTTGLPPGLSLNTTTGQITGTPTVSSAATNYTITASNSGGSSSTTINITVNGPPIISYATPQTYTVGTAIATLDDVSSGTAVGAFSYGTPVAFGTPAPGSNRSIAIDPNSGDVYEAEYSSGNIYKYNAAGTSRTLFVSGNNFFDGKYNNLGMVVDKSGNLFVSSASIYTSVYKFDASGARTTISTSGYPAGLTVDAGNNVYVAINNGTSIMQIPAGSTTANTYVSGLPSAPYGLAVDAAGNGYVSLSTSNTIYKIPAGSTIASLFATLPTGASPRNMTVDNGGNLYVANSGNNTISRITPTGTITTAISSGLSTPYDIEFDSSGIMYIANSGGTNYLLKVPQTGGYFINKQLPGGLYFDVTNGQFTGTPTAVSPSTNYTVTAYNAYGSGSTVVNITVNPPPPTISYTSPQTYTANTAITALNPTTTNSPTNFSASGLPAGLSLNTTTGQITGTPTTVSASAAYTITATNAGGSGTFNLTITINPAAPVITYPTPQTYTVGTAITALSPTNTGGAVGGYGTPTTFATVSNSNGLAVNPSTGYVYITSSNGNSTSIYNSAGTAIFTQSGTTYNYNAPAGIIVDAAGSTYVANRSNNTVVKTTSANVVTTLSGFSEPTALTMDAAGNIYVVNRTAGSISKINAAFTTVTPLITTGLNQPWGITINASGDLYVSAPGPGNTVNTIYKYAAGSTTQTTFVSSGLSSPRNMVTDASGNIYVADAGSGSIKFITPAGVVTTLLSGLDSPTALALDASGNLYATGYNFGTIYKSVITGYTTSPALPAGLALNNLTGVITGTPLTSSPATIYNITATNVTGSSTFALTITVNLPIANGNYAFSQTITLNTSALGISSTLTNFPYLVYIKEDALKSGVNCANNVQYPTGGTNGYDFAFTTSGGTNELSYDIESFDPATGTLLAWVQVPSITSTNSTLKFYFGSAAPSHPASFAKGTWGSDYITVFHMNETPSTGSTTADATSNARNGTTAGMAAADISTGKIGTAYSFNGSSKKISAAAVSITGPFTLSAWINLIATGSDQKIMTNQDGNGQTSGGFKLGIYNNNQAETEGGNVGNRASTSPAPPNLANGVWVYVQGVYTGTTMSNYVNGSVNKTLNTTSNPYGNNPFYVGVGEGGNQYYFNGQIDEARISNVAKSADWLKAEYNNQNTPATYTISTAAITSTLAAAAPLGASLVYTWTGGGGTQNIAATGNWTAPTSGNPAMAPPTDGTASIVIPAGLSNYPALSANASFFGVTLASGATINLNSYTMSVGCNIYNNNNTSNGILYSNNNASQITWNGISATQSYIGTNTTFPAQVGTMVVNNTTTGATVNISGGRLDVYSLLTLTAGSINVNTTGALTLKSTATQTAAVDKITNTANRIDGYVNVERFMTGGGSQLNRGYRLMSSPVNQTQATAASTNTFGISYLKNHTYLNVNYAGAYIGGLGGTGSGFSGASVGPTIYLYKESLPLSNTGYISGKHVGISAITTIGTSTSTTTGTTATVNTTHATDAAVTNLNIPVGNGFLLFFVGPSTRTNGSSATAPADATITANGYLNQGPFTVNLWYTPTGGVGKLSNSAAALPGFNMIGNPYASTINLQTVLNDNSASIDNIYVLNSRTGGVNQNYIAYTANGSSSPTAQGYAVSGGGFIVHAKSSAGTGATLSFNEAQKVPATQPTGSGLIMSTPRQSIAVDELGGAGSRSISAIQPRPATETITGFYVKMEKDTTIYDYCGIYFKSTYAAKFEDGDARYLAGPTTPVTMASLSSDGVKSAVNLLPDYKNGARIKLNVTATTNGLYKIRLEDIRNIDTLYNIYLVDKLKKDSLNIRRYGVYNFNVVTTDTTTFGANRFELSFQHKAVPAVVIAAFNGNKVNDGVKLNWKTYNESNYTGFTLEKLNSVTGRFEPIYEKQSDGSGSYNFVDLSPASGTNLYRLKQNDIDGKISYSDNVKIFYDKLAGAGLFSVFPNPTVEMINVSIPDVQTAATYKLVIFNAAGNLMLQKTSTTGNWTENIANLKPGAYVAEVTKSDGTSLGKAKFIKR